jgi:circadian clock protein KaiC
MLNRLIDFLKGKGVTGVFTSLAHPDTTETTEMAISSLIDTWLLLRTVEISGERNSILHILKSRGMAHSNQVREFNITDNGIQLTDVYIGEGQLFTGSARAAQEARDRSEALSRKQEMEKLRRDSERNQKLFTAQIDSLKIQLEQEQEELGMAMAQERVRDEARALGRKRLSETRKADSAVTQLEKAKKRESRSGDKRPL